MLPILESTLSGLPPLLMTIVSFILVLSVTIAVHEWGHLWTGRQFGIKAEIFALGFGKRLIGWTDHHGTEWRICAVPLGGYVKFAGDKNAASQPSPETIAAMTEEERKGSFLHASLLARSCTIAAGPLINVAFAIVVFSGLALFQGSPVLKTGIQTVSGGPAYEAGIRDGDVISAVDGQTVLAAEDVIRKLTETGTHPVAMTVLRDGKPLTYSVTPKSRPADGTAMNSGAPIVGIRFSTDPANISHRAIGPIEAVSRGLKQTYLVTIETFSTIGRMITGKEGIENLTGPIRIAAISGDIAEESGLSGLVLLIGVLSISIGVMNLMPIPVLDGGHLLLNAYEAIARRRPNRLVEQFSYGVGFAFVLSLMIFATMNDIAHLAFK